jgi:hypothetical protein
MKMGRMMISIYVKLSIFFCKAYTNAVKNKMRWNEIDFHCGNTSRDVYSTPQCMNRGSLKAFVKEFKRDKERNKYYPNWSDLDMKEGEPIGPQTGEEESV